MRVQPAKQSSAELVWQAFNANGPIWFEGVARSLSDERWNSLRCQCGINSDNYGTARILACDLTAERHELCRIRPPPSFGANSISVEILRGAAATKYVDLGLDFLPPDKELAEFVIVRVHKALTRLAAVPEVAEAIGCVLASLHALRPPGPDYDVSYSDPAVPFSIFVGIGYSAPNADLRLAESILHECMHLQLTLIEEALPVVKSTNERNFSPWQMTMRPVQGVVHGLYVFQVIRQFIARLAADDICTPTERDYLARRDASIRAEVAATAGLSRSTDLTEAGRYLVDLLQR